MALVSELEFALLGFGQVQWLCHMENLAIVQMLWVGGVSWQPALQEISLAERSDLLTLESTQGSTLRK